MEGGTFLFCGQALSTFDKFKNRITQSRGQNQTRIHYLLQHQCRIWQQYEAYSQLVKSQNQPKSEMS